jgi:hypothetical protein
LFFKLTVEFNFLHMGLKYLIINLKKIIKII